MLKVKYLAAVSLLAMAAANTATAADGTINFTGEIVANTCTIANNGNVTVALPKISANHFTAGTERAGQTAFNIALSDCTPAEGTVAVRFTGDATQIDTISGLFKNNSTDATPAKNVAVAVYDSADTLIKTAGNSSAPVNVAADGTASIPLTAWYQATTAGTPVTVGPVTATGGIELVYN